MEDTTKRVYIAIRLEKARDDLITAHDVLKQGHLRAAVNRAYYTIFHVASAALLWVGIERKRHSGVQSAFSEYFVKPGIIETEFSSIYRDARRAREQQDYDLEADPLTLQAANKIVYDAERFVTRLEHYLRDVGAISDRTQNDP